MNFNLDVLQVSGLSLSVECGMMRNQEAFNAVMELQTNLSEISKTYGCENNSELAILYLEARKNLDELKRQLKQKSEKDLVTKGI